jgi:hypothetical protein
MRFHLHHDPPSCQIHGLFAAPKFLRMQLALASFVMKLSNYVALDETPLDQVRFYINTI